jgi:hypothetical protein
VDHVARLIRLAALLVLAAFGGVVWGYPAQQSRMFAHGGFGPFGDTAYTFSSPQQACASRADVVHQWWTGQAGTCSNAAVDDGNSAGDCHYASPCPTSGVYWKAQAGGLSCPNGGTLNGTNCVCPAGQVDTGTACQAPTSCPGVQELINGVCTCPVIEVTDVEVAGVILPRATWQYTLTREQWQNAPTTVTGCRGSCSVTGTKSAWVSGTGFYRLTQNGQLCSGDAIPSLGSGTNPGPTSAEDDRCLANGGLPYTLNGVRTCLDRRSVPQGVTFGVGSSSTETRTNPDGSTTTTTTTQQPVTVCEAGACNTTVTTTTTVVTRDAAGNVTGTTTTTRTGTAPGNGVGGDGGTCDPSRQQCGQESRFGGSCAAGFVCDGDAVECAIAREQYRRNCEVLEPVSGGVAKGAAESAASDAAAGTGVGADFLPRRQVDVGTIATGERIAVGDCPAPTTVQTPLGAFVVDLTRTCEPARWFGWIIVAAALVIAARIVVGGV